MKTVSFLMCPGMAAMVFQMGMTRVLTTSYHQHTSNLEASTTGRTRTVVHQLNLLLTGMPVKHERSLRLTTRDLLQQPLRVRPRDRQTRDLRDVPALQARRVRIRGRPRGSRVPGVERQVLHASALHGCRVARGPSGVRLVAVRDGYCAVVARVGVDEYPGGAELLCAEDLRWLGQ